MPQDVTMMSQDVTRCHNVTSLCRPVNNVKKSVKINNYHID